MDKPESETRNLVLSVCEMKQHGELPPACCATQCVTVGVRMFLFGGADEIQSYADVYVLEIAREYWHKLETYGLTKPTPRYGHSMSFWSNHNMLIVFGGMEQTEAEIQKASTPSCAPPPFVPNITRRGKDQEQPSPRLWYHRGAPTNSMFLFDTTTSEWTLPSVQGQPPSCRSFHSATVLQNPHDLSSPEYLMIHGGTSSILFQEGLSDMYLLDLNSMIWYQISTQLGDVPSPRFGHRTVFSTTKQNIYLFGGDTFQEEYETLYSAEINFDQPFFKSQETNNSNRSDIIQLKWTKPKFFGTAPLARKFHSMAIVGEYIYVISGLTYAIGFSDFYVLDLGANRWLKPLYEHELNFIAAGSAILADKILVFGGLRSLSIKTSAFQAYKETNKNFSGATVSINSNDTKISRHLCFLSVLQLKTFMSNSFRFKLVAVGNPGVGKSCLLQRFTQDIYNDKNVSTIGVDFYSVPAMVQGKLVTMQLWDTAGQERYSGVTGNYYRNSDGFVIVYDATNQYSFECVLNWIKQIQEHHEFGPSTVKLIIGNKQDLTDEIKISDEDGKQLADRIGAIYLGTSAKTGAGVDTAFLLAAKKLLDLKKINQSKSIQFNSVQLNPEQNPSFFSTMTRCCAGSFG